MKIIGIQTRADLHQSDDIVKEVEAHTQRARELGGKLICFPELFALPFFPSLDQHAAYFSLAEEIDGKWLKDMCRIAKHNGVNMIAPFFEKDGCRYFNSAAVIGAEGEVLGTFRKMFIPLTNWNKEKNYFTPGCELPIFEIDGIKLSVMICYDRHYPELARLAALRGADLLVVPTTSSAIPGRVNTYEAELISRAIENNLFIMGVNRFGRDGKNEFFGKSVIVSPDGVVLNRADDRADVWVAADISHEEVIRSRIKFGHLRDVRKEIFEQIVKLL